MSGFVLKSSSRHDIADAIRQVYADEMSLSPMTVKSYISRLLAKVNCRDRAQLVILAYRSGVVTSQTFATV